MSDVPGSFLGLDKIDGREVYEEHRVAPDTFLLVDVYGALWLVTRDTLDNDDQPGICIPRAFEDAFRRAVNMVSES